MHQSPAWQASCSQLPRWIHERLARVLERHDRSLEGDDDAPGVLAEELPALRRTTMRPRPTGTF